MRREKGNHRRGAKNDAPEVSHAAGANGDGRMKRKAYEKELRKLQVELCHLQDWVRQTGARVIIVFEGRDAAGKGGTIKAITERVSPRVFRVIKPGLTVLTRPEQAAALERDGEAHPASASATAANPDLGSDPGAAWLSQLERFDQVARAANDSAGGQISGLGSQVQQQVSQAFSQAGQKISSLPTNGGSEQGDLNSARNPVGSLPTMDLSGAQACCTLYSIAVLQL